MRIRKHFLGLFLTFILILISEKSIDGIEFSTQKACLNAKKELRFVVQFLGCYPKGDIQGSVK